MVVRHPPQEAGGEGHLVGVDAGRRRPLDLRRQDEAPAAHLRPVLDRLADVLEDLPDLALDAGAPLLVTLPVDREQHPRLRQLAHAACRRSAGDVLVEHLVEPADGIPRDDELRVDDEVDVDAGVDEGTGDRVDEERHVVGDDLHDGPGVGPAVVLRARVVHPYVGHTGESVPGELQVAARRARVDVGGPRRQLVDRDVPEVALDEVVAQAVRCRLLERRGDRGEDVLTSAGLELRHGGLAILRDSPGRATHPCVRLGAYRPPRLRPPPARWPLSRRPDSGPRVRWRRRRSCGA